MLKKVPHTYVIIFYIIIFSALATWIIPGGEYVKKIIVNEQGVETYTMTYHKIDSKFQTWEVFSALFKGFEKQAGIIAFILIIGGAFWIMNASEAINVGIFSFLRLTKKIERISLFRTIGIDNIILTLIMLIFSVFGAVFGMSEETIAFIIIIVPLAISMGYDSIVGVSLTFVAAGLGFAGAVLNPFTIGIAQGLSGIPLFSGIEYRMFSWVVINFIGIFYVLRYARKVKRNPEKSIVYKEDEYWRKKNSTSEVESLKYFTPISAIITYALLLAAMIIFSYFYRETTLEISNSSKTLPIIPILTVIYAIMGALTLRKSVHYFILTLLFNTIVFLIVGVMGYKWYIMEIATLFFAMGLLSGIAMNYNPDKIVKLFLDGVKDILSAAIVVGLAGGIIIILQDGKIIDSILYYLSQSMDEMGKIASVSIMYAIQTVINIIIPSGSAKAALTMPIMAPFSDLIGISRQATVMAFQFGDGFTNMITPTSGVLIAVLGVAKIPYEKWVKWITPLMIILIITGLLLLFPTVTMKLNGF